MTEQPPPNADEQQSPAAPSTNALALAGFLLGLAAWVVALLLSLVLAYVPFGLLAVVFGFIGINTANRLGGKRFGLAVTAVMLGFTPAIASFAPALLFGL